MINEAHWEDCLRGAMWEEKWRGKLEDHPNRDKLRRRAVELDKIPKLPGATADVLTDLPRRRVGLGTYKWNYNLRLIELALRLEVPIIDTAETYGYGKVESALGKVLSRGRGGTLVATKLARNHMSRKACLSAARRSRDRLRVDCIDLYQIHWPVPARHPEVMDAVAELKEEKVIERFGVCNFCGAHLDEIRRLASERGLGVYSNQIRYNRSDAGAADILIPYCVRSGVRVIAYSPLGQGSERRDAAGALAWVLSNPGVAYVIPATNNLNHLRSNTMVR